MGASSSRARGGQQRGVVVARDATRHNRQRQKPLPQRRSANSRPPTQDSPRRVVPLQRAQAQVDQNASSNSGNIQGLDRRHLGSVNDGRNSNGGTEASPVTRAIKTPSNPHDDAGGPDVTCGLEALKVQEEPKASNSAVPTREEYDDECIICLEVYDEENPRLLTQCEHHYHFHCILEWMERNHTCPICGRVAIFDETTVQVNQLPAGSMDQ